MAVREWFISEALASVRRLDVILSSLTEEEVIKALALEKEALRRKNIITRLERQFRTLARTKSAIELKEKLNGP